MHLAGGGCFKNYVLYVPMWFKKMIKHIDTIENIESHIVKKTIEPYPEKIAGTSCACVVQEKD